MYVCMYVYIYIYIYIYIHGGQREGDSSLRLRPFAAASNALVAFVPKWSLLNSGRIWAADPT